MSEFDAAIKALREAREKAVIDDPCPVCQIDQAIRILQDWPKWKPLIEAAGKIGGARQYLIDYIKAERDFEEEAGSASAAEALHNLFALLAAIPEEK